MNRYLKRVCRLAEIVDTVEVIKARTGRLEKRMQPKHELVTMRPGIPSSRGMPVEVLQKVLSHGSSKTTLIYAKIGEDFQPRLVLGAFHLNDEQPRTIRFLCS